MHEDIYKQLGLTEPNLKQKMVIKSLLKMLLRNNCIDAMGQKFMIDECLLKDLYQIFIQLEEIIDINYSTKQSVEQFCDLIIKNRIENNVINFCVIFCPGYEARTYQKNIGRTTQLNIKKLKILSNIFSNNNFKMKINCFYADIFVENYDVTTNSMLLSDFKHNKISFKNEILKVLKLDKNLFLSEKENFNTEKYFAGFIDKTIINMIPGKIIRVFTEDNYKFYTSLGLSHDVIKERNLKLLTIYSLIADFLKNNYNDFVYIPMENMYKRTKLFESKNICCLYFKKGDDCAKLLSHR